MNTARGDRWRGSATGSSNGWGNSLSAVVTCSNSPLRLLLPLLLLLARHLQLVHLVLQHVQLLAQHLQQVDSARY